MNTYFINHKGVCACVLGAVLVTALTGCANVGTRGNVVSSRPAAVSVDAGSDWSWSVSGDRAVRPQQVFSLNGKTYLQMRSGQLIPAVVVDGEPVPFKISAPYIVVQGEPKKMDLIANGYRALVVHRGPVTMPSSPKVTPNRVERGLSRSGDAAHGQAPTASRATHTTVGQYLASQVTKPTRTVRHASVDPAKRVNDSIVSAKDAHKRIWRIKPSQRLLSKAVAQWSASAGYTLHWKSRVDVPITGLAEYRDTSYLSALGHCLADAGSSGYSFYFSTTGKTVTVISIRSS